MEEFIEMTHNNKFTYCDLEAGNLFTEFIIHKKNWIYKYFSKSTYSDKIDLYWVTKCDETKGEKQFLYLSKQCNLINMIPKIDELTEIENFRRIYLLNKDFIDSPPPPYLIETYTLPYKFIELQKQIGDENDERDKHLKWILHSDTDIFETIDPKSDVLRDFDHFRKEKLNVETKLTRVLKNPFIFRQSICMISVFVWINRIDPLDIYIYSEPFLTLLKEPEIFQSKSVFHNKYTYRQVISGLK